MYTLLVPLAPADPQIQQVIPAPEVSWARVADNGQSTSYTSCDGKTNIVILSNVRTTYPEALWYRFAKSRPSPHFTSVIEGPVIGSLPGNIPALLYKTTCPGDSLPDPCIARAVEALYLLAHELCADDGRLFTAFTRALIRRDTLTVRHLSRSLTRRPSSSELRTYTAYLFRLRSVFPNFLPAYSLALCAMPDGAEWAANGDNVAYTPTSSPVLMRPWSHSPMPPFTFLSL